MPFSPFSISKLMSVTPLPSKFRGLSAEEVNIRQRQFGHNMLYTGGARTLLHILWEAVREPMFLILVVVCSIYFLLGSWDEGQIMLLAMAIVVAVSIYQEWRSAGAIKRLRQYAQGRVQVIRDGTVTPISAENLVPGDVLVLSEGEQIPADAVVLQQNDCAVDEAIMTGESVAVLKSEGDTLLQGTTVTSGLCYAEVQKTGNQTALAKLGKSMEDIAPTQSLLQRQVSQFVRRWALIGLLAFIMVFGINYASNRDLMVSLLLGLVITMTLIPEEIPVAFSSFMAIGAYRMSRIGLLVKQPVTVESLGSASVICLDKTGTITENKMSVAAIYDFEQQHIFSSVELSQSKDNPVVAYAMWASEPAPFDPMEKALHTAYEQNTSLDLRSRYHMIREYPLEGRPPMMTHVWQSNDHNCIIAGKGGVERILRNVRLPKKQEDEILAITRRLAAQGYRVLGVAKATVPIANSDFPQQQDNFQWIFLGLVALYDPPKPGIRQVFEQCYQAGVQVKMLTGDYPETAITIANESGLRHDGRFLTGEEVMYMSKAALQEAVREINLFTRVFPEAKLRIVEALQANGEIVAMTGDGVNDGPALKAANIGIAMGSRGTDIAKKAASLVITDDDPRKIIDAIANGRKIYYNLKKAIRYIISIHIPIIFTVLAPLLLNWEFKNIFTPVHIIFLEIIMGPTCSIFFENEPIEEGIMRQSPRRPSESLFSWRELSGSIVQGLVIALGVLSVYYWTMTTSASIDLTRTVAFITLLFSNVFLTLTNRSFKSTIITTIRYKNNLLPLMLIASGLLLISLQISPFLQRTFLLTTLQWQNWLMCAAVALVSVFWFELYKWQAVVRKERKTKLQGVSKQS